MSLNRKPLNNTSDILSALSPIHKMNIETRRLDREDEQRRRLENLKREQQKQAELQLRYEQRGRALDRHRSRDEKFAASDEPETGTVSLSVKI